jgi:hypothetical protein
MSITLLDNLDRVELENRIIELENIIAGTDVPKVYINGVIPTTKDDVLAELTYVSSTETFHSYITIKC